MALTLASVALTILFQPTASLPQASADTAYESLGRRDPFSRPGATRASAACVGDLRCYSVDSLELRGILRTPRGTVAMVTAGNQSFLLRPGDALRDGIVSEIGEIHIIFEQAVSDPLSVKPTHEVTKSLHVLNARLP